ncbi:MAG: alanine dehydrogenase [Pseudomonadota bacterium]
MHIGVPTEIKNNEFRVGLTPGAVREYVAAGHTVSVQAGAGLGIAEDDARYRAAGATIVPDADAVFAAADMIVKVKEPQASEIAKLRAGQLLFTYLHLAADREQTAGLLDSGATAIAYETVTDSHGRLPLLAPMSEVAGRLSVQAAASALTRLSGGRGLLMGGVPGVPPATVAILGGGVVGTQAARMAVGLGAEVTILDRSLDRLRELDTEFRGRVRLSYSTAETVAHEVSRADAIISAVLLPGASAPKLVSRSMLSELKPGAVLVDVAIDQGGCFETSRPTTHAEPTYIIDGIVHYCVANMPGAVPRTSAQALNNATLPYGLRLAADGLAGLRGDVGFLAGLNVHRGQLTSEAVADSLDLPYVPALRALDAT